MKFLEKNLLFAFILTIVLVSCSSDDNNNSSIPNTGSVNLIVSGDVEGEKSGMAFFQHIELSDNVETWGLQFFDNSTFDIDLSITSYDYLQSNEGVSRPSPGTYPIGFDATNSDEVFFGIYTDIPNGDFANMIEYSTFQSSGTLIIETSNEERVTGSFEFTAHSEDDLGEIMGTVNVSGDFEAYHSN